MSDPTPTTTSTNGTSRVKAALMIFMQDGAHGGKQCFSYEVMLAQCMDPTSAPRPGTTLGRAHRITSCASVLPAAKFFCLRQKKRGMQCQHKFTGMLISTQVQASHMPLLRHIRTCTQALCEPEYTSIHPPFVSQCIQAYTLSIKTPHFLRSNFLPSWFEDQGSIPRSVQKSFFSSLQIYRRAVQERSQTCKR